jgi:hypothetical protein
LNFEKWRSYKPSDHDDWWGRAVND